MNRPTTTARPETPGVQHRTFVRAGRWCLVAAVVGVLQGGAVLVWPHQVPDERFSYPMTATWFVIAQATFFLQHLPLAGAIGTLATSAAVRRHRTTRTALLSATVGLVLLAVMELVAMTAATTPLSSTLGTTISSLYGLPTLLAGAGLVAAGVALVRRPVLGRPLAWGTLLAGLAVFVVLIPALASGSFVGGRLAIMVWMGLFGALGVAMTRRSPDDAAR